VAAGPAPADPAAAPPADKADAEGASAAGTEEDPYPFTDAEPANLWMPVLANPVAEDTDFLFYAILGLAGFCFIAITIAVVYLSWRYRHRPGHKAEPSPHHDNVLEITWTVIPSIICVFIFLAGWKGFLALQTTPEYAMDINVTAKKWDWTFEFPYEDEVISSPELHVPVGETVKLRMRADDVLHSLWVPAFRIKQDVIPNRYTYLWFRAEKPGVYRLYCTEYCGTNHSNMKTKVVVHKSGGFEQWRDVELAKTRKNCREEFAGDDQAIEECLIAEGEKVYRKKGCPQCHTLDGSGGTGPTFQGMWGQTRNFTDGSSAVVDDNYIRESVLEPQAKVRTGFNPVMPPFKGKLKDKDIDALATWMKTL
jgi:cytochrome c oxidase subunit 2